MKALTHHNNADIRVGVGSRFLEDGKEFAGEDEGADKTERYGIEFRGVKGV